MKTFLSPCIFLAIALLSACSVGTSWKDDNIPSDVKSEVNAINDQFIEALRAGNSTALRTMCSPKLLEKDGSTLDAFFTQFPEIMRSDRFITLHAFYESNSSEGKQVKCSTGTGNHDYSIDYKAINKESYVIVGTVKSPDRIGQCALVMIYGKYGTDWKLNILRVGMLSYEGKDAYAICEEMRGLFRKGDLADAVLKTELLSSVIKPGTDIWTYKKEKEIQKTAAAIAKEAQKRFILPYTCTTIATQPVIFRVHLQEVREGIFPLISYDTKLNIKDTSALKVECDALHAAIGTIYPGIDLNNTTIFYRAVDHIAQNDQDTTEYWGFIKDTGKKR